MIRVNSQSGKGGASYIVEQALGVTLPRWMQIELAQHIQNAAESQARELNSDEIVEIFTQSFMPRTGHYALDSYQTEHDSQHHSIQASLLSATSTISLHGQGSGSLSAFTDALHKATGIDIQVVQFEEQALSEGSDAQAISFVQISMQGQRFTAAGRDNDTLAASLQSIINAVNIAINNGVKAA